MSALDLHRWASRVLRLMWGSSGPTVEYETRSSRSRDTHRERAMMNRSATYVIALSFIVLAGVQDVRADQPSNAGEELRVIRVTPSSSWHGRPLPKQVLEGERFRIVRVHPPSAWSCMSTGPCHAMAKRNVKLIRLVPARYKKSPGTKVLKRFDARALKTRRSAT